MFGIGGRRGLLKLILGAGVVSATQSAEAKLISKSVFRKFNFKINGGCDLYISDRKLKVKWDYDIKLGQTGGYEVYDLKEFIAVRIFINKIQKDWFVELIPKDDSNLQAGLFAYCINKKQAMIIKREIEKVLENV